MCSLEYAGRLIVLYEIKKGLFNSLYYKIIIQEAVFTWMAIVIEKPRSLVFYKIMKVNT